MILSPVYILADLPKWVPVGWLAIGLAQSQEEKFIKYLQSCSKSSPLTHNFYYPPKNPIK